MNAMHNTDRDFWNGDLNLMRIAFFLGRRTQLFQQYQWMKDAELCEIDVAFYFNAALDKINEA